jgi:glycosyltransferase involved in cell wall biosynthesis
MLCEVERRKRSNSDDRVKLWDDMQPRIAYWTGTWEPQREAISKEIIMLRAFNRSKLPVVSFSPEQRSTYRHRDRAILLSSRRWMTLRAIAAAVEAAADLNHVFGGFESWHLLRSVGRRPILLTTALLSPPVVDRRQTEKVTAFAAEAPVLVDDLRRCGVPKNRIELVYPGVDLAEHYPAPLPAGRLRVLFASSPRSPRGFEERGIPMMVEAARHAPDVDFVFLWRDWDDPAAVDRAWRVLDPPRNVTILRQDAARMALVYAAVHVVACCYKPRFGKVVPNSIVEGLACGRPALVSETCGIADLVRQRRAGVAVGLDWRSLVRALRELQANLPEYAAAARRVAVEHFDVDRFRAQYAAIYDRLVAPAARLSSLDALAEAAVKNSPVPETSYARSE